MLIGFTIMQNAFAGGGLGAGSVTDSSRKALALTGSGDVIYDWDVAADRVFVSAPRSRCSWASAAVRWRDPAAGWLDVLHPVRARPLPRLSRHDAGAAPRAASTSSSACAPPMAIISGTRCARAPSSAPTAR